MPVLNMTGGASKPEQEKSVSITSNGTYEIIPDADKALSKVTANVQVSGGGGSARLYLSPADGVVIPQDTWFALHSDTELSSAITLNDLVVSSNITSVTFVDTLTLHFGVSTLALGDTITIRVLQSGYKNHNGDSELLTITVSNWTYEALVIDSRHMTIVRNGTGEDTGADTFTMSNSWPAGNCYTYPRVGCNSFSLYGDSYAMVNNFGGPANTIMINNRDAKMYYTWKQEGIVADTTFVKIRWRGAAVYNSNIDTEWEIIFLGNGDAYIHLIRQSSTWSGTFRFLCNTFTLNMSNPIVSFYRRGHLSNAFDVKYELYDPAHHISAADTMYEQCALSAIYTDYVGTYWNRENSKNDDNTNSITIAMPWSYGGTNYSTIYINGNSWIGLGSKAENVKMNRRDAAVYYERIRYAELTDQNNLHATQIIWGGSSHYIGAVDQWWSLWLFENGDAMIHIKQRGSYTDGTSSFYNVSFTAATDAVYSFYRNDAAATSWTMETGLYDVTHHRV